MSALAVRLPCDRTAGALQAQSGAGKAPAPQRGACPCALGGKAERGVGEFDGLRSLWYRRLVAATQTTAGAGGQAHFKTSLKDGNEDQSGPSRLLVSPHRRAAIHAPRWRPDNR